MKEIKVKVLSELLKCDRKKAKKIVKAGKTGKSLAKKLKGTANSFVSDERMKELVVECDNKNVNQAVIDLLVGLNNSLRKTSKLLKAINKYQ